MVRMTCAANDGHPRSAGLRLCRECVGQLSRAANSLALNVIPLKALALREWRHASTGHGGTRAFAPLPVDVSAWDTLTEVADAVKLAAAGCGCPGTFGPADSGFQLNTHWRDPPLHGRVGGPFEQA